MAAGQRKRCGPCLIAVTTCVTRRQSGARKPRARTRCKEYYLRFDPQRISKSPIFLTLQVDCALQYVGATELAQTIDRHRGRVMFPERLTQGYSAFVNGRFVAERARYERLAETGQRPEIMVVGCVDSRVSPELIFDAAPGELLVVRNVANLVPAYKPNPIRKASTGPARHWNSPYKPCGSSISSCSAMPYAAESVLSRTNKPAVAGRFHRPLDVADRAGGQKPRSGMPAGRRKIPAPARICLGRPQPAQNLMTFPCVRILVERGKLALHGAYFGIATGGLLIRDPATGNFEPVAGCTPRERAPFASGRGAGGRTGRSTHLRPGFGGPGLRRNRDGCGWLMLLRAACRHKQHDCSFFYLAHRLCAAIDLGLANRSLMPVPHKAKAPHHPAAGLWSFMDTDA